MFMQKKPSKKQVGCPAGDCENFKLLNPKFNCIRRFVDHKFVLASKANSEVKNDEIIIPKLYNSNEFINFIITNYNSYAESVGFHPITNDTSQKMFDDNAVDTLRHSTIIIHNGMSYSYDDYIQDISQEAYKDLVKHIYSTFIPDGLLLNIDFINSKFRDILGLKNLLTKTTGIVLDYTFQCSKENLRKKVKKYYSNQLILIIVALDNSFIDYTEDKSFPNLRIVNYRTFCNFINLDKKNYDIIVEIVELIENSDLEKLEELKELFDEELCKTSCLQSELIKRSLINSDVDEFFKLKLK